MKKLILLSVIVILILSGTMRAAAQDAVINNVIVTRYQNNVYVYFTMEGCFTPELEEAIKSGIETTFTFSIVFKRHRGGILTNPRLIERVIKHTVKYDTLLQEYTVVRNEDGKKPVVTKDFETVKRIMSQVRFFPLVSLSMLEKGNSYRLEIRGQLDKGSISKALKYFVFFSGVWDFETPWYVEEFSY
jgi:hypothetical protein